MTDTEAREQFLIAAGQALAAGVSHFTGMTLDETVVMLIETDPEASTLSLVAELTLELAEEEPDADILDIINASAAAVATEVARTYLTVKLMDPDLPWEEFTAVGERLTEVLALIEDAGAEA